MSNQATRNALHDLVEEGSFDKDTLINLMMDWMGDHEVARMVNECTDFEGTGIQDEDEEDEYATEITNIIWDHESDDDITIQNADLPESVDVEQSDEITAENAADYLSDEYGWTVLSCNVTNV